MKRYKNVTGVQGMAGASPVTTIPCLRGKPRSGAQYSSDRACPCHAVPCHNDAYHDDVAPRHYFAAPIMFLVLLVLTLFLYTTPALAALHDQPVQSQTLVAGPYTIVVGLSTSQPIVDQDFTVTIVPRGAVTLSGTLQAQPGPGTDGIVVRRTLVADAAHSQALESAIRVPVRGAWTLVVSLNGPQGTGSASMDIIVAVPNAIPPWQGWTIGLLPLVGFAWLIWRQWAYRRTLLKQAYSK